MYSQALRLKSARLSRILVWLLRVSIIWDCLSVALTFITIIWPVTSSRVATFPHLPAVLYLAVNLAILGLSLIWIYYLHRDLRQCYKSYPLDAWDALVRFIVPLYNIWGIWNVLRTIARYFKAETGRLHGYGLLIHRLVPVIYGLAIASNLLHRLLYGYDSVGRVEIVRTFPTSSIPIAIAGKRLLGLVGAFVILAIAQAIMNGIQLKATELNNSEQSLPS